MSKLFILPFVTDKEVCALYQKFDPFPIQSKIIYWCEKILKGLGFAIALIVIVGLSKNSEKLIILLAASAGTYGVIYAWILLWRLRLEQEKSKRFIETNPRLL